MDQKPFRQRTIDEFLDDLGSSAPAPGGGAAAGLLGAQACALAEMVCHLTAANKNYADFHDKANEYLSVFNMARSIFLDLMDEDAANFLELMKTGKAVGCFQESDFRPAADGADDERASPLLHRSSFPWQQECHQRHGHGRAKRYRLHPCVHHQCEDQYEVH